MNDFSLQIASRTLYGEARGEPDSGKVAVAHVLVNRMRMGRWGRNLAAVCWAYKQFSCWNHDDPNRAVLLDLADDEPTLAKMRSFVEDAASGASIDPTGGATHYFATSIPDPFWVAGATFCGQFGHHKFYKDVK